MSWSKWDGIKPIDAGTFLERAVEEADADAERRAKRRSGESACPKDPHGEHGYEKIRKHDRSGPRGKWVVVGYKCYLCDAPLPAPEPCQYCGDETCRGRYLCC